MSTSLNSGGSGFRSAVGMELGVGESEEHRMIREMLDTEEAEE